MTQARKTLVERAHAASYHCVDRCVPRAWLCGFDDYLQRSFEHRRWWVERRIFEVGNIFVCGIDAYALMSNHYHLVVHMSPKTANTRLRLRLRSVGSSFIQPGVIRKSNRGAHARLTHLCNSTSG